MRIGRSENSFFMQLSARRKRMDIFLEWMHVQHFCDPGEKTVKELAVETANGRLAKMAITGMLFQPGPLPQRMDTLLKGLHCTATSSGPEEKTIAKKAMDVLHVAISGMLFHLLLLAMDVLQ